MKLSLSSRLLWVNETLRCQDSVVVDSLVVAEPIYQSHNPKSMKIQNRMNKMYNYIKGIK